jgi:hypothetical protein
MKLWSTILAVAATTVSACTGSQPQASASLVARDSDLLCEDYYVYSRQSPDPVEAAKIRAEIERRSLVPPNEWSAIDKGQIGVGASQCGVFAAWGPPRANNQTVQGNQQQIQLVYSNRTVTTNGTVVTAISK